MAHHSSLPVYFHCTSNPLVQVYSSLALRVPGADACAIDTFVMVAESKFLADGVGFCGIVAKMAIYHGDNTSRAFSVCLWRAIAQLQETD